MVPLALVVLLFPALLLVKRPWAARLTQVVLTLGAIEWVRTLLVLAAQRQAAGHSWVRLAVILGAVALVTLGSAFLISLSSPLRARYRLE
jgi:hypothetical protein